MTARQNKRGRSKTPPGETFVALRQHMRKCDAWRTLPHAFRSVYIEMAAGVHDGNNGTVKRSVRFLAKVAGCSRDTVERALFELRGRGFVVRTEGGHLGTHGVGVASAWRLTEFGTPSDPKPTRDYARWKNPEAYPVQQDTPSRSAGHPPQQCPGQQDRVSRSAGRFGHRACPGEQDKATSSQGVGGRGRGGNTSLGEQDKSRVVPLRSVT